jgi:class 3 adenylate cyclase
MEADFMASEPYPRKLVAILSADVKGYSLLMAHDELSTVQTLTAYRTIMAGIIQEFRGRVVDSPGDNLLAEFASVVDAVGCAVKIQGELKSRNHALPEERRMAFRIGINLGDVIQEGERIYGDGVNIAARIEGLAEAEGICISGPAYDQVENKAGFEYEYLGEHKVKNIIKPVRVYKILMEPGPRAAGESGKSAVGRRGPWKPAIAAVILLVGVAGGMLVLKSYFNGSPAVDLVSREGPGREGLEVQKKADLKTVSPLGEATRAPDARQGGENEALMARIEKIMERLSRFEKDMDQILTEKAALEEKLRHAETGPLEDKARKEGQTALTSRLKGAEERIQNEVSQREVLLRELERLKAEVRQPRLQVGEGVKESAEPNRSGPMPGMVRLRSEPASVGLADFRIMLKRHNFYVSNDNESGIFHNNFEDLGDGVVIDKMTGLMWEKGGSSSPLLYADATGYVAQLKEKGLAGYRDWRIPTVEELCSLLQSPVKGDEVFPGADGWRRPPHVLSYGPEGTPEIGAYRYNPHISSEGDLDNKKPAFHSRKPCWTSDINAAPTPQGGYRQHYVVDLFSADVYGAFVDYGPHPSDASFIKAVRTAVK